MAEAVNNKLKLENCFVHDKEKFSPFEEVLNVNCYTLDYNLNHYYNILKCLKEISCVLAKVEDLHKKGIDYFARECESNALAQQIAKDIKGIISMNLFSNKDLNCPNCANQL
jgi:hypothetical protein